MGEGEPLPSGEPDDFLLKPYYQNQAQNFSGIRHFHPGLEIPVRWAIHPPFQPPAPALSMAPLSWDKRFGTSLFPRGVFAFISYQPPCPGRPSPIGAPIPKSHRLLDPAFPTRFGLPIPVRNPLDPFAPFPYPCIDLPVDWGASRSHAVLRHSLNSSPCRLVETGFGELGIKFNS